MSIFGKMDAAAIQTNAFWVEAGTYSAEVTKGEFASDDNGRYLKLEYTITDEDSQFLDSKLVHKFTLPDPEMTQESFNMLPAEDQKKLRRVFATMKRTLCGDGTTRNKGLGVAVEDLNDENWDPTSVVGTKVRIGVANGGADNSYVNIRWVNIEE